MKAWHAYSLHPAEGDCLGRATLIGPTREQSKWRVQNEHGTLLATNVVAIDEAVRILVLHRVGRIDCDAMFKDLGGSCELKLIEEVGS